MAVDMNYVNEILKEERAIIREQRELAEATYHNQAFREARKQGRGLEFLKNCKAVKRVKYHTLEIIDPDEVIFEFRKTKEAEGILETAENLKIWFW